MIRPSTKFFRALSKIVVISCLILLGLEDGFSQIIRTDAYLMEPSTDMALASNTINDVIVFGNDVWLGTGRGISRTSDNGLSFVSYGTEQGIGQGGVSAIAVSDAIVWVATGFDTTTEFGQFSAGGGLAYSLDDGLTWNFVPQPGPTNVQNVTFDIALRDDEVWIASFGGGLRKSSDLGQNWQVVAPDSFVFDALANLNHRGFSVLSVHGVLWVGTAGGVNRSNDGGDTWTNFNHQNQTEPISGNFVVAVRSQQYDGREIIWAATRETTVATEDTSEFRGVSWTEDQGFTWETSLRGETVHNFAFDGSDVYAASNNGLFKSIDGGETWALFPAIENATQNRIILSDEVFAAGISPGSVLWAGTGNGLGRTTNNGLTWNIFQVFTPTGRMGEPRTYAYPNPFSPSVHNTLDGFGYVRFQYNTINDTRVTIKIYDFSMDFVTTVVEDIPRTGNGDFYEIWNGQDARGSRVDNGVYFYRLDLDGDGQYWGKLIVLN